MQPLDELIERNREFARRRTRRGSSGTPARRLAIVTCMDARIDVYAVLGLSEGDAHVLRNAGATITDDVIRSLSLSQHYLGTDSVVVIGHTNCAMLDLDDVRTRADLAAKTGGAPAFEIGAFSDLDAQLRNSMSRLRSSRMLRHKGSVHAFVYDVETGLVREIRD